MTGGGVSVGDLAELGGGATPPWPLASYGPALNTWLSTLCAYLLETLILHLVSCGSLMQNITDLLHCAILHCKRARCCATQQVSQAV